MRTTAKISLSLMFLIALVFGGFALAVGPSTSEAESSVKEFASQLKEPTPEDIDVLTLFNLTNQHRANAGLKPLSLDPRLNQSAANKCTDMLTKNYYDHNAPDGTEPWDFIDDQGVYYYQAGENLAQGFSSAEGIVRAWMNSPTHRKNILQPNFEVIGFSVCQNVKLLTVQHFADLP